MVGGGDVVGKGWNMRYYIGTLRLYPEAILCIRVSKMMKNSLIEHLILVVPWEIYSNGEP